MGRLLALVVVVVTLASVGLAAFVPQQGADATSDFGTSCDGTAFNFESDDFLSKALAIARAAYEPPPLLPLRSCGPTELKF
jgi:hypothetical protein